MFFHGSQMAFQSGTDKAMLQLYRQHVVQIQESKTIRSYDSCKNFNSKFKKNTKN